MPKASRAVLRAVAKRQAALAKWPIFTPRIPLLGRQLYPDHLERAYAAEARSILASYVVGVEKTLADLFAGRLDESEPCCTYLGRHYHRDTLDGEEIVKLDAFDDEEGLTVFGLDPGALYDTTSRARTLARWFKRLSAYHQEAVRKLRVASGLRTQLAAEKLRDWTRDQFVTTVRGAIGVNLFIPNPWLRPVMQAWTASNVDLIVSIPSVLHDDILPIVREAFERGLRWEELRNGIEERFGVAESRAELIARDQMGKLSGELSEAMQTNLGVENYTWRNAGGDERVRDTHVEREGHVFAWDGDGLVTVDGIDFSHHLGIEGNMGTPIHPGLPIQCRCYPEPDLTPLIQ